MVRLFLSGLNKCILSAHFASRVWHLLPGDVSFPEGEKEAAQRCSNTGLSQPCISAE